MLTEQEKDRVQIATNQQNIAKLACVLNSLLSAMYHNSTCDDMDRDLGEVSEELEKVRSRL